MKTISLKELKKGVYVSEPAYLDEEGNYILLSPDVPLSQELIIRLQKWGYRGLIAEDDAEIKEKSLPSAGTSSGGSASGDAASGDTAAGKGGGEAAPINANTDAKLQKIQQEVIDFYLDALEYTEETFDAYKENNEIPVDEISELIRKMIDAVREYRHHMLNYSILEEFESPYLVGHSVRTTILAISLGESLKWPPHRLLDLGIATFLHEIGMVKLPETLHETKQKLSEREHKALTAHTVLGYRNLKSLSLNREVLMGVLQHHERVDGSGYPQQLKGPSISDFGHIIGIVCSFDAQNTRRPYRQIKDGHTAIMNMLKGMGTQYNEKYLRQFVFLMSLYPLGTYVKLSNGTIGIVDEGNSRNPRFPKVRVMLSEEEIPLKEQMIVQTAPQGDYKIDAVLTPDETDRLKSQGKIPRYTD